MNVIILSPFIRKYQEEKGSLNFQRSTNSVTRRTISAAEIPGYRRENGAG